MSFLTYFDETFDKFGIQQLSKIKFFNEIVVRTVDKLYNSGSISFWEQNRDLFVRKNQKKNENF